MTLPLDQETRAPGWYYTIYSLTEGYRPLTGEDLAAEVARLKKEYGESNVGLLHVKRRNSKEAA